MMYKKNFVAVIRSNGQILREIDGVVTLPYQSEYSIMMKNLNSRKVQVSISIDGKDILDGKKLVIDGDKETELKGYMNGFSARNKFKFIQKTKEIAEHRGDKIDDGIVRIEYQFEKKIVSQRVETEYRDNYNYGNPIIVYNGTPKPDFFTSEINVCGASDKGLNINDGDGSSVFYSNCSNIQASNTSDFGTLRSRKMCANKSHKLKGFVDTRDSMNFMDTPMPEEGITVKGSQINQQFREVFMGELEESSSVIILKLRGCTKKQKMVYKPITVKTKMHCETCGRTSRSNAKFCHNCGTSLI